MRVNIFLAAVIILVLFASCKTIQEEPVSGPAPVLRSLVIFNTTSDPATGYEWEIWVDYDSTGRFALNNLQTEDIFPGAMGSPQKLTYTLRSVQQGRVFVHFIYKRQRGVFSSGDAQEMGRYIFTFNIAQDLTINHIDTQRAANRDTLPVIEEPEIRNSL